FRVRRLRVDPAFVSPPAGAEEQIRRDAEELESFWSATTPARLWSGRFERPVEGAAVSRFGTRSVFNGEPRGPHTGDDFVAATGTPVHVPNAGVVVLAREMYFSGNTVVIDHGLGVYSLLAHLSSFAVAKGDTVQAGQVVGRSGATGRVTGPHLHWAV